MLNYLKILRQLANHQVDFVIVGGLAASLHGNDRVTFDIDLALAINQENLARFAAAINPLRPRLRVNGPPIVLDDRPIGGEFQTLFTDFGKIDVLNRVPGLDTTQLLSRAVRIELDDLVVPVAHIEDLIALKEAAARPHDLEDAAKLRLIRSLNQQASG
jgi:predicted nucleotidyltransferase